MHIEAHAVVEATYRPREGNDVQADAQDYVGRRGLFEARAKIDPGLPTDVLVFASMEGWEFSLGYVAAEDLENMVLYSPDASA